MKPLEWIDHLTTPRWVAPRSRLAERVQRALVIDTTRLGAVMRRLSAPWRALRAAVLSDRPFLQRLTWGVRRGVWSGLWTAGVFYRLRPKAIPVPEPEAPIRLIGAPESYADFQSKDLVVPDDVPRAEMSLFGDILVQVSHLLQDVYPINTSHQPEASWDPRSRLRQVYPFLYRVMRAPPVWHDDLVAASEAGNLLGTLAVGGPFAKFLELRPDAGYVIDLEYLADYRVRDGLAPLGCLIRFERRAEQLWIQSIDYRGDTYLPGEKDWDNIERIALCSLVTHCTVWRHGMQYHVAGLAAVCVLNHNLPPDHALRRLLAPHTAEHISTNFHTHLTLRRSGFDVTGLSFSYETILRYYDDGARYFDLRRLDVPADIAARNIPDDLDYPYREQARRYWGIVEEYVRSYVEHHWPEEADLAADPDAEAFFEALDANFTRGIRYYAADLTRKNLIRFCTLFIYAVTVEHEDNTLWNYSVFLPTTVPADGGPQSAGDVQLAMNFQFLISSATNRLLTDFSQVALDDDAAGIMRRFRERLVEFRDELDAQPDRYWHIHPDSLESSVSA